MNLKEFATKLRYLNSVKKLRKKKYDGDIMEDYEEWCNKIDEEENEA